MEDWKVYIFDQPAGLALGKRLWTGLWEDGGWIGFFAWSLGGGGDTLLHVAMEIGVYGCGGWVFILAWRWRLTCWSTADGDIVYTRDVHTT